MPSPLCSNFSHLFLMVLVVCAIYLHLQRLDEHLWNLRPNSDEVCLQEERLDSPTMLMLISQNMSTNGGSW